MERFVCSYASWARTVVVVVGGGGRGGGTNELRWEAVGW